MSVFQLDTTRGPVERSTGLILDFHIYNCTRNYDSVRGYLDLSSQGSVLSSCDGFQVTCSLEDVWDKEEARGSLNALDRNQEPFQGDFIIHRAVGHHVGAQLNLPTLFFQDEHLEEMGGDSHIVLPNHLVLHIHLPIGLHPGQEEGSCADIDIPVVFCQASAVLLKIIPGILV